jgi:hypothetical protein
MRLLFILFFFSLSLNCLSQKKYINEGYVYLQYNGETSKPYPRILFYLPNSNTASYDTIATHRIEITEAVFKACKVAVEIKENLIKDSTLLYGNNYEFLVSDNEETTIFLTPYLSRIRHIINAMSRELGKSEAENRIKAELENVLIRIKYDNKLDK